MNRYKYTGSCHCENISLEIELSSKLNSYSPRACDCDFCLKHGTSYISDNNGKLTIFLTPESELNKYRHGDKIADFLICQMCGVLVAACYKDNGYLFATINTRILKRNTELKSTTIVSSKKLDRNEKIKRWQNAWFPEVVLINLHSPL